MKKEEQVYTCVSTKDDDNFDLINMQLLFVVMSCHEMTKWKFMNGQLTIKKACH